MVERLDDLVTIRIPTPLRSYTGGAAEVALEAASVGEALNRLGESHPGILERVLAPDGSLRPFVNVYLGADNIRALHGLVTPLTPGAVLAIVPAVAGGAGGKERRLAELRASIPELTPREALARQTAGAVLIDVREPDEVAQGSPPGALHLSRGFLELRIEAHLPDYDRPLITLCGGGVRSLFAAESLQQLGYRDVASVVGGYARWQAEGLPCEVPQLLNTEARERYRRHLSMPEVGEAGQARLLDSKVLLVGAGGLGCPAALYLAAAGVGTLGIVDNDDVDLSNLQRQVIHSTDRIGMPKVDSAAETINALNPDVKVVKHALRLGAENIMDILPGYDIVVDGLDNFPTRYLLNDASVRLQIPVVSAAILGFEGQLSVFKPYDGPCYRCLFPVPPPAELAPSCGANGVLGVLPGTMGLLQATEVIKLILGEGDPLIGRLLMYDALAAKVTEVKVRRDPQCPICSREPDAISDEEMGVFPDYEAFCAGAH